MSRSCSDINFDKNPLISVVIPCFNYGRYLKEAVTSVLDQTYPNTEILIVDDGSSDNTREIASSFDSNVKYIFQKNGGIGSARNTGIRRSNGELLSFLDADDLWVKDKLALQLNVLRENKCIDIVYGHAKQFHSAEVSEKFRKTKGFAHEVIAATLSSAMLTTRDTFLRVGMYSGTRVAVDQDWHMRSIDLGLKIEVLDDVLFYRRIHYNNNGLVVPADAQRNRLRVIKASLDRRRLNSPLQNN